MKKTIALLLLLLSSGLALAQSRSIIEQRNTLPSIGVVATDAISIDKEKQIGDVLMRQLRRQAPIVADPVLNEYLNDLGNRLILKADDVQFPFEFFWINNPEINAFAFFGGHIGIHTGLVIAADTESELASVVAHEISHVTQRHIARSIAARQKSSGLQMASMLGSLLLAMANPEAGMAALSTTSAISSQMGINYTRSNEQEADRVGFGMLTRAGFDGNGAASFFGKLTAKFRSQSKPPAFLLTHPLPESRVADARSREQGIPSRPIAPSLSFHLAKERIVARFANDAAHNVAMYNNRLQTEEYVFREATEYGLAIAYLRAKSPAKALDIITGLLHQDPDNLFYIDVITDVLIELKQFQRAQSILRPLHSKMPNNKVVALNLANAAKYQGDYPTAIQTIKDLLLVQPGHMLSYQLLTECYGNNKQLLEMHQAKAEWFALMAAYNNAIDELHAAYNYAAQNQLEKQRIRARIEQFRAAQAALERL